MCNSRDFAGQLEREDVREEEKEAADIDADELRAPGPHGLQQEGGQVRGVAPAMGLHRGQQPDPQVDQQALAAGGPQRDHADGNTGLEDDSEGSQRPQDREVHAWGEDHGERLAQDQYGREVQFVEVVESAEVEEGL